MTVKLTKEKASAIKTECVKFIEKAKWGVKIRDTAKIVVKLVSSFPGVLHGPLNYKTLDRDKISALTLRKGKFVTYMVVSVEAFAEQHWWSNNVMNAIKPISHGEPSLTITTDA